MVWNGELDIYLKNKNGMEIYFDTLYTGWLTGWYSILTGDDYSMNAKAKSQWVLIKLPFLCVDELREQSYELDTAIAEYEDYIANEGIPYWDYKIYRTGHNCFFLYPQSPCRRGIGNLNFPVLPSPSKKIMYCHIWKNNSMSLSIYSKN